MISEATGQAQSGLLGAARAPAVNSGIWLLVHVLMVG